MCARLRRSLYGTRDALARWEAFSLKAAGRQGICKRVGQSMLLSTQQQGSELCGPWVTILCLLVWSPTWSGRVNRWRRTPLSKSLVASEVTSKTCVRLRVLNRVLSWRSGGIQHEADPRHQEILISELEQGVRGLSTPGVKNPQRKDGDGDGAESLLNEAEAHSFRSTAARASYLALDRPDLAFATEELCRRMSSPTKADVNALPSGCPAICYRLSAWCTSSCGNLTRIWMCLWTRISRDA